MIGRDRAGKTFSISAIAAALLLPLSPIFHAQSSPLTVQPSTGRVVTDQAS